jgi:ElaB/YqjD/DUF883 family membrane-anchored ribosome-binding protein
LDTRKIRAAAKLMLRRGRGEHFTLLPNCQSGFSPMDAVKMTNTERTTYPSSSKAYGSPGGQQTTDAPKDDLAFKGAAALREAKAGVESVIADAGDKSQQALRYAGKKGQEAMDNVRGVGDALAVAIEKSVTTRPYTTLVLAVAAGFLFGATWRR